MNRSSEIMSSRPLVYIITVNWNRTDDTLACVRSLDQSNYTNKHILVIDNGSTENLSDTFSAGFPHVEYIYLPENLGFAGGFNHGIRYALDAGAEFVFIINNDTLIDPHAISALVEHHNPDTGIVAPIIYYADLPNQVWSSGGDLNRWNLEVHDPFKDKPDPGNWPNSLERDFVPGCAMLFHRQVLKSVGLFDEAFRLYYEDADLCRRMRLAGMRIRVIPAAKVWHKVAMSSGGSDSPNERYWMAHSSILFFRKHAIGWQWLLILTWRIGSAIRTSLRLIGRGYWLSLKNYWQGLFDAVFDKM